MQKSNLFLIVGLAVLFGVGFTLFFMSDLVSEASMYTDFTTALTAKKKVHVVGKWVKRDDYQYDSEKDLLRFWMADSLNNTVSIQYHDPMPSNFESAEKIVVVGKFKEGHFEADEIQMKCPSKYNKNEIEGAEHPAGVPMKEGPQ